MKFRIFKWPAEDCLYILLTLFILIITSAVEEPLLVTLVSWLTSSSMSYVFRKTKDFKFQKRTWQVAAYDALIVTWVALSIACHLDWYWFLYGIGIYAFVETVHVIALGAKSEHFILAWKQVKDNHKKHK